MHILCTICSDLVNQAENIFVTKCGHIFHHHCLVQWIERSKSCPQCRNKVTEKCMFRLYPTVSNDMTGDDAATLQSRLDDAQLQLRQAKSSCKDKDERLSSISTDLKRNEDLLRTYEKKLVSRDSAVAALKEQLDYVKLQNKEIHKLRDENDALKINLHTLNELQMVLNASADDVANLLKAETDPKNMALFATALKKALCESEAKNKESREMVHMLKIQLAVEIKNGVDLKAKLMHYEDLLHNAERKYASLKNKRKSSEPRDKTIREEPAEKQPRHSESFDLNVAILGESNSSLTTLVKKIENADSPYLNLKQSNLALSAMNRAPSFEKTSENAMRPNLQKATDMPLSIFHKKYPIKLDPSKETYISPMDVSFDGLGGHSKLDTFPTPKSRPAIAFKKFVPNLTSKHKLKRPTVPTGSQDIGKYIERLHH